MVFSEFINALQDELSRWLGDAARLSGPTGAQLEKLRIMYGSGEIDRHAFFQLLAKVQKGVNISGELGAVRLRSKPQHLLAVLPSHTAVNIYISRARLEEAREALFQAIFVLEKERVWLEAQADDFWQRASQAMPDEDTARMELEVRQRLLARRNAVSTRARSLRSDLRRIDLLQLDLRSAETDLLAFSSQEMFLTAAELPAGNFSPKGLLPGR